MGVLDKFHASVSGARAQIFMVSLICFSCPGMFNSLNAMGGAGQQDATVANETNTGWLMIVLRWLPVLAKLSCANTM